MRGHGARERRRWGSSRGGGRGRGSGNEGREWIGELEQRKLITRPVAFSWLDYLVAGERGERPGDWSSQERSFADAIFDFARPNGPEKFNRMFNRAKTGGNVLRSFELVSFRIINSLSLCIAHRR